MTEVKCQNNIVDEFNAVLDRCETAFNVRCVEVEGDWCDKILAFAGKNKEMKTKEGVESWCHAGACAPSIKYAVVALEKDTGEIAAYVSFNEIDKEVAEQEIFDAAVVKEDWSVLDDIDGDVHVKAIVLEFSCTGTDYMKRGLSILLRLLIITFAIRQGYYSVISSTNTKSGQLLESKFGFQLLGEKRVFIPETLASGVLINARLILRDENLGIYKKTYEHLSKCTITK